MCVCVGGGGGGGGEGGGCNYQFMDLDIVCDSYVRSKFNHGLGNCVGISIYQSPPVVMGRGWGGGGGGGRALDPLPL